MLLEMLGYVYWEMQNNTMNKGSDAVIKKRQEKERQISTDTAQTGE